MDMQTQIHPTTFLPSFPSIVQTNMALFQEEKDAAGADAQELFLHFGLQQLTGEDSLRNSTEISANMAVSKHGLEKRDAEKKWWNLNSIAQTWIRIGESSPFFFLPQRTQLLSFLKKKFYSDDPWWWNHLSSGEETPTKCRLQVLILEWFLHVFRLEGPPMTWQRGDDPMTWYKVTVLVVRMGGLVSIGYVNHLCHKCFQLYLQYTYTQSEVWAIYNDLSRRVVIRNGGLVRESPPQMALHQAKDL